MKNAISSFSGTMEYQGGVLFDGEVVVGFPVEAQKPQRDIYELFPSPCPSPRDKNGEFLLAAYNEKIVPFIHETNFIEEKCRRVHIARTMATIALRVATQTN